MEEPTWADGATTAPDRSIIRTISYYAAPKTGAKYAQSIDDVPPEILADFEKLGIPLKEAEVKSWVLRALSAKPWRSAHASGFQSRRRRRL